MTLASFVSKTDILPSLGATSRWEAIDELLDAMTTSGSLTSEARAIASEALVKRERSMSTAIGKGVAIPHATINGIAKPVGAFGRSEAGIDFDAPDGNPVRLVLLFLVPKPQFQSNVGTLAAIARFLSLPQNRAKLEAGTTVQEIVDILKTEGSATL